MSRALLLVLGACGGDAPAGKAAPAATPPLETLVVARESARRERVWDGVIEAVNQATLSAQTGGRVLELPFDVDDYVPAGAVVAVPIRGCVAPPGLIASSMPGKASPSPITAPRRLTR